LETIKKLQLNGVEYELGGTGDAITVDTEMSDESTNPVQNKVVKSYIDTGLSSKAAMAHTHSDYLPLTGGKVTGNVEVDGDVVVDGVSLLSSLKTKLSVSGADLRSATILDIAKYISNEPGMSAMGRFCLPAVFSPIGVAAWYRCVFNAQNAYNSSNKMNCEVIAMREGRTWYGLLDGNETSGFTVTWQKLNGMQYFQDPSELKFSNEANITAVLQGMPMYSQMSFWINDTTYPNIFSNIKANTGSHGYGNVEITRWGNIWELRWIPYNSTVIYTTNYSTVNSQGWTGWRKNIVEEKSGSMTLASASGCTISGFSGYYYKIGRLVWFRCSFTIAKSGSGDISINCLPFTSSYQATCPIDYHNAIFKASGGSAYTSLSAGTNGGSTALKLYGWSSGRSWTLNSTDINTSGTINISGTYIATS